MGFMWRIDKKEKGVRMMKQKFNNMFILFILLFMGKLDFLMADIMYDRYWETPAIIFPIDDNTPIKLERVAIYFPDQVLYQLYNPTNKEITAEFGIPLKFDFDFCWDSCWNYDKEKGEIEIIVNGICCGEEVIPEDKYIFLRSLGEIIKEWEDENVVGVPKDFIVKVREGIDSTKKLEPRVSIIDIKEGVIKVNKSLLHIFGDVGILQVDYFNLKFLPGEKKIIKVSYQYLNVRTFAGILYGEGLIEGFLILKKYAWKEPIKEIFFIDSYDAFSGTSNILMEVPGEDYFSIPIASKKTYIGEFAGACVGREIKDDIVLIKYANNIILNDSNYLFYVKKTWDLDPGGPNVLSEVQNIKASSYLKGKTKIFKESYIDQEYYEIVEDTGEYEADFMPYRLFDNDPRTAWCEGVKGSGIGEYVEFELKYDAWKLGIVNGFYKVGQKTRTLGEIIININDKRLMYFANNGVSSIEIVGLDNNIRKTISVPDTWENNESYGEIKSATPYFVDINLPKGKYRIYIRDIYKGYLYDDTCIGEIMFLRDDTRKLEKVVNDKDFFKEVLTLIK